jgi:Cu/Ag efflux protein CusF
MLRSTFLRSAMAFAAVMSAVAAAGSARCQPLPELTKVDEIAIRGTILAINRANRTFVVESRERDTLTFKAIDRVTNFDSLKPGQQVDMRYYRVTDYLVAQTTPEMTEMARVILSDPARAPGLPGTEMRARLWSLSGMVVRTDMAAKKVEVVDPSSGEIIRSPWIKTPEGQAELAKFKPGDMVTMVFSERSAFEITPVR